MATMGVSHAPDEPTACSLRMNLSYLATELCVRFVDHNTSPEC